MSDAFAKLASGYTFIKAEGYITIKLSGVLEYPEWKNFEKELPEQLGSPIPYVVINCADLSSLSKDWLRTFLQLQKSIMAFNHEMRLIQVKPALQIMLKREGVDAAFKKSATLRDALVDFGLVSKKMLDTDFINPFLEATIRVLKIQASIEVTPKKVMLKQGDDAVLGDISGIIGIVSETFNGSVVICFPETTFLKVMTAMLGEPCDKMTKEIVDGAGELTNMIFGQAKIVLNEKGYGIKTALPSVVTGKDHTLQALTKGPVVVIPMDSSAGNFFVEICLSA